MSDEQNRAKAYQRKKNWLVLINIIVMILLLVFVLQSGLSVVFRNAAQGFSLKFPITVFFYFIFLSLFFLIFDLCLDFYGGYLLEHRFGLSNQSLLQWVWETAKRYLLTFIIAVLLVEAFYLIIHFFPRTWWVLAWVCWILFSVVFGKLAPVLIVPLFYKYSPVSDESLRSRILDMVRRNNLQAENVYELNLSKTTRKANAAFCGFGKTRRIVLADTLVRNFSHDEILNVVAHEVGHYRKKHIWKHIGFNACTSFVSFYLIFLGLKHMGAIWYLQGAQDVAALPLMGLLAFLVGIIAMPLGNLYSRFMERQADKFALDETKDTAGFISMMEKLGSKNLADPEPHPLIEFLIYSHPSIKKRISFARAYEAGRV